VLKNKGQTWGALCISLFLCCSTHSLAQNGLDHPCPVGVELAGRVITSARIEDPWNFLRFFQKNGNAVRQVEQLQGKPYNKAEVQRVRAIVDQERFLPDPLSSANNSILITNCTSSRLDLTFFVFSFQISPNMSMSYEFRQKQQTDPAEVAGVEKSKAFRISPQAGYNATENFFGGGSAAVQWHFDNVPLSSFSIQGYGSSTTRWISASLSGNYNSETNWLANASWAANFTNYSLPTAASQLNRGRMDLQLTGSSRPLSGIVLRFGFVGGGGNEQSGFSPTNLAPGVVPSSGYSGVKFLGGMTTDKTRQSMAISYGIELGSTGTSVAGDWRKQIGDAAYEFWTPFGDHRLFEVEQRFTAGGIQILSQVPVGELFFGGNRREYFLAEESWQIPSNPYIRSLPANSLYQTSAGAGGTNFYSYNVTAAVTAWRKPLVPSEVAQNQGVRKMLDGGIERETQLLEDSFVSDDSRFREVRPLLSRAQSELVLLDQQVRHAQVGAPSSLGPKFDACEKASTASARTLKHAIDDNPLQSVENIGALLDKGSGTLPNVLSLCDADLNQALHDPAISTTAAQISFTSHAIEMAMATMEKTATSKAESIMAYPKRVLQQLLDEANIAAVSPLLAFDVAHIGPTSTGPFVGTHYGLGGGVRFTLASTVNFNAGYSWNVNRRPGEGAGAFFFSLTTRNLFR